MSGHTHVAESETEWAERAAEELARAGYRRGGARETIIDLLDAQGCALSVFEIEAALRDRGSRQVARASIYRVLEELEHLRLITRLELGEGLARFEPARADGHHHHMICEDCGTVVPFEDAGLERSIARLSRSSKFNVADHDVVLRGSCGECSPAG